MLDLIQLGSAREWSGVWTGPNWQWLLSAQTRKHDNSEHWLKCHCQIEKNNFKIQDSIALKFHNVHYSRIRKRKPASNSRIEVSLSALCSADAVQYYCWISMQGRRFLYANTHVRSWEIGRIFERFCAYTFKYSVLSPRPDKYVKSFLAKTPSVF